MATNGPESNHPKAGGLWARLFGVEQTEQPEPGDKQQTEMVLPQWDKAPPAAQASQQRDQPALQAEGPPPMTQRAEQAESAPLVAQRAEAPAETATVNPVEPPQVAAAPAAPAESPAPAESVAAAPPTEPMLTLDEAEAVAEAVPAEEVAAVQDVAVVEEVVVKEAAAPVAVVEAPAARPAVEVCPICASPRKGTQTYCDDCGWTFGASTAAPTQAAPAAAAVPTAGAASGSSLSLLKNRYEVRDLISERAGISRHRGRDLGDPSGLPVPVIIVRGPLPEMAEPLVLDEDVPAAALEGDEFMPTFEDAALPVAAIAGTGPAWPSVGWEKALLEAGQPSLPRVLDSFAENNYDYLVEEFPQGQALWDAWYEPESDAERRYGWLKQVAEALDYLHKGGAVTEGLRPDAVIVNGSGQAVLADLSGLLPLPLPPGTPVRDNLYTAPELVLSPQQADARADLYTVGAMLYSLEYLTHNLEEKDFERPFTPHQITDRFPDVHPALLRLVNKTFVRDLNTRFPTDEAGKEDATGFRELIRTLEVCQRTFDRPRLDIAAWTTTGMVRTGNEDAFAFLHAVEAGQDDLGEYALLLLADGMGGYEAGEVAAAMAIAALRKNLLDQPMFAALAGKEQPEPKTFSVEAAKKVMLAALKYANREVFTASRTPGKGRRGMGCTAEAVYVDPRNVVVGHVGDSRTYHLHQGRLVQLTRDQTLVNRLVELGVITEEEAENHDRKNELQQAIGGQPDVEPGLYASKLKRGDWVLVCSDGLTNHVPTADLEKMLLRETSGSAEDAARRLLNLVNLRGATDNATVVVIRAV